MLAQLHRQLLDFLRPLTCDSLRNSVTPPEGRARGETFSLYSQRAERKYLNRAERERALRALNSLALDRPLFAQLLAWTGGRVSEVLALTACTFQLDEGIVSIVTLKQRKVSVREVPLPPSLMDALNEFFDLRRLQQGSGSLLRLWPFCRMTAWRFVKEAMKPRQGGGSASMPEGLSTRLRRIFASSRCPGDTRSALDGAFVAHDDEHLSGRERPGRDVVRAPVLVHQRCQQSCARTSTNPEQLLWMLSSVTTSAPAGAPAGYHSRRSQAVWA